MGPTRARTGPSEGRVNMLRAGVDGGTTAMYLRHCAIAFSASIGIAACSTAHIDTGATAAAEALYDSLYPDYAEICAVSELKKKPGSPVDIRTPLAAHPTLYF